MTVANLKGGCGKSTIAINLAGEFASKSVRVVVVDADAQGTATAWARAGKLPFHVESMPLEDHKDASKWVQRVLAIDSGYLIVDCPPHLSAASQAAVGLSDLVLIPVFSSAADLVATVQALELLKATRADRQNGSPACLMIPSRVDRRTAAGREVEGALKQFGEPIGPAVHQRAAFIDALTEGKWIGDYAPASSAHDDITALAMAVRKRVKP